MAACNEEQRKVEMKKRRQYQNVEHGYDGREQRTRHNPSRKRSGTHSYKKNSTKSPDSEDVKQPSPASTSKELCYQCGKTGHLARDCRTSKSESRGRDSSARKQTLTTKQVTTALDGGDQEDPRDYLLPDSDDGNVKLVHVQDRGSQPRRAQVQIGGVLAWGIVDSGADITIIGKDLLQTIAAVGKLRKRDCKKPDKVPRTYDRKPFTLHGMLELEISFAERKMMTTVYIKMDTCDQLLLSEGVCGQLGIIHYHPSVWPSSNKQQEGEETRRSTKQQLPKDTAIVPTVRVQLLRSVAVPPLQRLAVEVKIDSEDVCRPLMLEPQQTVKRILIEPSLLNAQDGIAAIEVTNQTGFTQHLPEGMELGEVTEVTVVPLGAKDQAADQTLDLEDKPCIRKVSQNNSDEWRTKKVRELFRPNLNLDEEKNFCQTLEQCHQAFCLEDNERGETDLVQLEIDTVDSPPKLQRSRRIPFALREEVAKQIKNMQESGVIQPSNSPWASPVVLVRKKDGTYRFCVDYREVNAVTKKDKFPLPRVDDLLDQLGEAQYFSTLDLASGYWQIRVHPESQAKTAFVTHQGLHEFRVMPFGLTNAPSVFQRLMQRVLMNLNPDQGPDFVSVYIDDILVFSRTLSEHTEHLKKVLQRLIDVGLKLKPTKCRFIRQEVDFLGHVITPQGLKTSQHHIAAVTEFPVPQSVTEVRQFMGLTSYYRRFVKSFAQIAQPLHALTHKGAT